MAAGAAAYQVKKTVSFLGRRVPIMLQDVNGPCPLLAIANVLLLRNQLQLPAGVGEVSQDRLVQMVAERLLDCNSASLEGGQAGTPSTLSEEQRASLAHNLGDAIGLLPKLTTGIDVNLRFHAIDGFEYTQETAVFDLLDIPLVHGWLVDPQDEGTARAVSSKSYNELMVQLVTALGSSATPRQLTPAGSFRSQQASGAALGGGEGLTPRASGAGPLPAIAEDGGAAAAAGAGQPEGGQQRGRYIDAAALSAALQHSLRLAVPPEAAGGPGEADSEPASARSGLDLSAAPSLGETPRAPSSLNSMQTSDSMHSMVNRMLTDLVSDAFTGTPKASMSPGQAALQGGGASAGGSAAGGAHEEAGEEATSALRPRLASGGNSTSDLAAAAVAGGSGGAAGASAAAAAAMADAAGAEAAAAGSAPALPLGSPSQSGPWASPTHSADWRVCELSLEVLDAAAVAAAGVEGPVRVRLTPLQPPQPLSPFDSLSPSNSSARQQLAGAGSGAAGAGAAACSTPATPHPSCASMAQEGSTHGGMASPAASAPAAADATPAAPTPAAAAPGSGGSSPGEDGVRDALLVQQFLEGSPSQLTVHGLVALQEGLRPNQLAVFFRNNHFNTMFKGPGGQLYILATDEGFQYESDVVWEHLISVDGDTALVGADFRPFQMHASQEDAAARQAAAHDADWAAAAAAAGGDTHDADLALAMQLQAEDEDRVQQEQERRRQQQEQQQARQQQQQEEQQRQRQQQQQVLPSQRRPSSSGDGSGGAGSRRKEKKKSSTDNCCMM